MRGLTRQLLTRAVASSSQAVLRSSVLSPQASSHIGTVSSASEQRQNKRAFHSSPRRNKDGDPYKILGVGKDSSSSDIKKAYYQLAKKYHPDSNKEKSAKEKFVEIQNAYDTLSDDAKRSAFDRYGSASQQSGFDADAYARATSSFGGSGFNDFFNGGGGQQQGSDIFDSLFGAFGRGGQARQGQAQEHIGEDIEIKITLPFEEAAKGTARTVNITPVVDCKTCTGSGLKAGAKVDGCKVCGGSGTRMFTIQGGFTMAGTCQACLGKGTVKPLGSECEPCNGVGKVREHAQVDIAIPAGIDHGMRLRVDGRGDAPLTGQGRAGNLYARIDVLPSKIFKRQGNTLFHEVSIPFYTAILGGTVRIPTLEQAVDLKVSNGTQAGEEMVLKGRGVPKLNRPDKGDLVVRFNVTMPRTLSPAQRRILNLFVSETEHPGSSAYAPSAPAAPKPPKAPKWSSPGLGYFTDRAPASTSSSEPAATASSADTASDVKPDPSVLDSLLKGAKTWLSKK